MDRDRKLKCPYYVVYDYGQGDIVGIVFARSKEEITSRFPYFNVFDEIPYDSTPEEMSEWEWRTYDIDNGVWAIRDFANKRYTFDP